MPRLTITLTMGQSSEKRKRYGKQNVRDRDMETAFRGLAAAFSFPDPFKDNPCTK